MSALKPLRITGPRRRPFPVGTEVGAERWANSAAHPDCWLQPWKGVVLEVTDQRAWMGTIAFPTGTPTVAQIRTHLAAVAPSLTSVPVLWDFGAYGLKVYWERPAALRRYAVDVELWESARAAAFTRAREASRRWRESNTSRTAA